MTIPLVTDDGSEQSAPNPLTLLPTATVPTDPQSAVRRGRKVRTYTAQELAERRAWGKEWGQVGRAWKLAHTYEGNR